MLELTRLNGQKVVINCELIEYIEANPDTTITLTTSNKFVVKENVEEIVEKVVKYKNRIYFKSFQIEKNTKEEEEK